MTFDRTAPPIVIGDVVIEAVERSVVQIDRIGPAAIVGMAFKRPVAVVVRSPAGVWQVDLDLDDLDLEDGPDA